MLNFDLYYDLNYYRIFKCGLKRVGVAGSDGERWRIHRCALFLSYVLFNHICTVFSFSLLNLHSVAIFQAIRTTRVARLGLRTHSARGLDLRTGRLAQRAARRAAAQRRHCRLRS